MSDKPRAVRGEMQALVIGVARDGGRFTVRQISEQTGEPDTKIGPAVWRLVRQGRMRTHRDSGGRTPSYEFIHGEVQALNHAIIRAPKHTIIDKVLTLLGQFEQQSKIEALELGKLREENTRLRRAMKELAGKI